MDSNGMAQNYMQPQYNEQPEQSKGGNGMAIASMVLGIVALVMVCCIYYVSIPCGILSIVFAIMVMKQNKPGRGMAIAGLVCSIVAFLFIIVLLILGSVLLSSIGSGNYMDIMEYLEQLE